MLTAAQQYIEDRVERITETGCWIWLGALTREARGYGQCTFRKQHCYAHHLSWEAFHGPRGKLQVLHQCDVTECVNPAHLYLGTAKQNTHDRLQRGKRLEGIAHGMAKLEEHEVLEIRAIGYSRSAQSIADEYGVSRATIDFIRTGKTWKHLKPR